jgi:hypothetical protein
MQPEQPTTPAPNNYDFILNPEKPSKPTLGNKLGQNAFAMRILAIVGGALVLMAIVAVVVNLFFNNQANVNDIVAVAQTEQEIIRLSDESGDATSQAIKEAAVNTGLSLTSHQQSWLAFLGKNGRKVPAQELNLKKSAKTDKTLTSAKQSGTFDTAYITVMRTQLEAYSTALKNAYAHATSQSERTLLQDHYADTQLLLKQWPAATKD